MFMPDYIAPSDDDECIPPWYNDPGEVGNPSPEEEDSE